MDCFVVMFYNCATPKSAFLFTLNGDKSRGLLCILIKL